MNVGLQRKHVCGPEPPAGFQHVVNTCSAPRSLPLHADRIRVVVWSDSAIGCSNDSRRRIGDMRKFVEWDIAGPLVIVVCAAYRQAAVASRSSGNFARGLVADVSIDIRIHYVLSGGIERRKRAAELITILRRIHVA